MPDDALELLQAAERLAYEAPEVQLLLSKESVKAAFEATLSSIAKQWEMAETTAQRELLWAKRKGIQEFRLQLRIMANRQRET